MPEKPRTELRAAVVDQVALSVEEPIFAIRKIAGHRSHPRFIGRRCDARDLDATGREFDHEQDVECDPSSPTSLRPASDASGESCLE